MVDPGKPPPRELAAFDFTGASGKTVLELWPAALAAPVRKKRQLLTRRDGNDLLATTHGPDPYFSWEFETPPQVAALSIDVDASAAGSLQLFWTNADCATFNESCSTIEALAAGRQTLYYVLDAARPLAGLRLDPPEVQGLKLRIHGIRLLDVARFPEQALPKSGTTLTVAPDGLHISTTDQDPWLVFATPWLDARLVESAEVELRGATALSPQIYWTGSQCPVFGERCQTFLKPVPGKKDVYAARLAGLPGWQGRIHDVRFDPENAAGQYVLGRLVFVRSSKTP